MNDFVARGSIVRRIWSDPDLILLVFAGAAAEFALNRAVDWLFFTNRLPADPINRFFSTVNYAQRIIFAAEPEAALAIERINRIHQQVEAARGASIPDWAHRDVLYLLLDYSERAFELLHRPLRQTERDELFQVFHRFGAMLRVAELPENYAAWQIDRSLHLKRDLAYTDFTRQLFEQYRRHLGEWRYRLLLDVQALLAPEPVARLLGLNRHNALAYLIWSYGWVDRFGLQKTVRQILLPPEHLLAVEALERYPFAASAQ